MDKSMLEESGLTGTSSECNNFNQTMFIIVAAVRGFSGTLSFLASLSVIFLILIFRKYHFFVQRLILYLSMASALNGISKVFQVGYRHPVTQLGKDYCTITAFLDQISDWSVFLSTLVITIHLYIKAVHNKTVKLEALCLIVIFALPISFNWVPFIHNTYRQAGPWCWIELYDPVNCKTNKFGMILRITLWFVPSNVILCAILVLYVIMLISLSRQKHQYKVYNPQQEMEWKMKKREVQLLILYPLVLIVVEIPAIVNRFIEMFSSHTIPPALWFIQATLSPLQGGLVCLAYALDPETRARIRKCTWRSTTYHAINEYPAEQGLSDSISDEKRRLLTLKRPRTREPSDFISGYEQSAFQ